MYGIKPTTVHNDNMHRRRHRNITKIFSRMFDCSMSTSRHPKGGHPVNRIPTCKSIVCIIYIYIIIIRVYIVTLLHTLYYTRHDFSRVKSRSAAAHYTYDNNKMFTAVYSPNEMRSQKSCIHLLGVQYILYI